MGKVLQRVREGVRNGLSTPVGLVVVVGLVGVVLGSVLFLPDQLVGQAGEPTSVVRFQRAPTRGGLPAENAGHGTPISRFQRAPMRGAAGTTFITETARFQRQPTRTPRPAPTSFPKSTNTTTATVSAKVSATVETVRFQRRSTGPAILNQPITPPPRFVRATRAAPDPIVEYVPPALSPKDAPATALHPPVISLAPGEEFKLDQPIVIIGTGNPGSELQILIDETLVDTTFIDRDGVWGWRFQPEVAGSYEVTVVDISRVFHEASDPIRLSVIN